MSDPIDYDELLSRVLDDEASATDRARVARDGSLSARLELLRRTQAQLAEPPPPLDDRTVDALVARAMQEAPAAAPLTPTGGGQDHGEAAPPVAPLAERRGRRRTPWILGAAAALLVVLLAVPVLSSLGGDDGGGDSSSDEVASQEAGDAMAAEDLGQVARVLADRAEPLGAMGTETPDAAEEPAGEAVPSTTVDELAQAYAPVPPGTDPVTWCRSQLVRDHPDLGDGDVRAEQLTYRGQDAVAYLYDVDGSDWVLVASATTCEVLDGPSAP